MKAIRPDRTCRPNTNLVGGVRVNAPRGMDITRLSDLFNLYHIMVLYYVFEIRNQ